ncbi:MAG: hypothetical protein NTV51_19560, partial [Verrucomicrobia bacterium]|nr:hypothetical protein [Verrucomicrobiota bacterium]
MRKSLLLLLALFTLAPVSLRAQETWLPRTSGVTTPLWGVAYGNNLWVAVGELGTIVTSPDGITWTKRNSGFPTRWLVGVTYANNLWVVVGGTAPINESQGLILTSPDGITWTPRINGGTRVNNVVYGNGTFVAVDDAGGRWTSADGLTWSYGFTRRSGYLRALAYGAPAFVTTGLSGIQSTFDGISYDNRVPASGQIEGLAYGRKQFVAVGTLGVAGITYSSRDGLTWTQQPTTSDISARGAAFFNNLFLIVGSASHVGGGLATSFDGTSWTERNTGLDPGMILLGDGAGPTSAIAVGQSGTILQSPASVTAPSIAAPPVPVIEAVGGNVAFTVTARGSLPLAYQWRRDGIALEGATDDTLFLASVQGGHSGNYSCVVSNHGGAVVSSDAALVVTTTFPAADPVDTAFTLGPSLNVAPRVAVALPDGKILIGGNFLFLSQGQPQYGLARLNADGSLDPSFRPAPIDPNGTVLALAVQSDGKVLLGGSFTTVNGTPRNRVARLNADGSFDPTFAPSFATTNSITQIVVDPDGRILLHNNTTSLTRLTPTGALDPTWTASPIPTGSSSTTTNLGTTQAFDVQLDGKILLVVTGFSSPPNPVQVTNLVRLNANGAVDATFNTIALGLNSTLRALRVLADGRIMVAVSGTGYTVQRFSATGLFDASFTINPNVATTQIAASFTPDGRTWLSGLFNTLNSIGRNQLARLNVDGSVDATYNPGTGLQNAAGASVAPAGLFALDDGRALVTGDFTRLNGLARTQLARLNSQSLGGANGPAIVAFAPLYREVPAGAPLTIPINASGSAFLSYSYTGPGANGGGFTGGRVNIPAGVVTLNGAYTVTASNSVGTSAAQTVFVRIVPSAPFVIQQPAALQTNLGRPIALIASFGGTGGIA